MRHFRAKKPFAVAVGIGMVACMITAGVSSAEAKTNHVGMPGRVTAGKAIPARPAVDPAAAPAGYTVVAGSTVSAPTGTQTRAQVSCPGKTKPVGGGGYVDSTSTLANLNSSFPTGKRSWAVDVSNASGSATNIAAYAVCVNRPSGKFTLVTASFNGTASGQTQGTATCTSGVVVGGGVYSSTSDLAVNINSLFPSSTTSWRADMNNGSATDHSFIVYAFCRNTAPGGYKLVAGTNVPNPAGTQSSASVTCPGAKVPLSGGVVSSSSSTQVNLNFSIPNGQNWLSYENNASASAASVTPYAICAGK